MSAIKGPQLYDIRFKNERIAYELSLQENFGPSWSIRTEKSN
jgi:hypothetical protein